MFIRLILATAVAGALYAAEQPETPDKIEWIAKNTVVLRSLEPNSGFADLEPLKLVIGDAQAVMLGAPPRGEGKDEQRLQAAGLNAQARLVRFLHEQMGFDLLITKASLFDAGELDRALDGKRPLTGDLRDANLRDHSRTDSWYSWRAAKRGPLICSPAILDYAQATRKTLRPLRIDGLGLGLSRFAAKEFPDFLFSFIDAIDSRLAPADDRRTIRESMEWGVAKAPDGSHFVSTISRIFGDLSELPPRNRESREAAFMQFSLEDVVSWAQRAPASPRIDKGPSGFNLSSGFAERVFRRLQWLAHERRPGTKAIICLDNDWLYAKTEPDTVGGAVRRVFERVYSIAFTGFRDDEAIPATLRAEPKPKLVPAYASVEGLMSAAEIRYGFLDLSRAPFGHWLWQPIAARLISDRPVTAIWPLYCDGVLYIEAR